MFIWLPALWNDGINLMEGDIEIGDGMIVIDQKPCHLTAGIDHGQTLLLIQKQITDAVAINLQRHQRTENIPVPDPAKAHGVCQKTTNIQKSSLTS